jgi:hypothetical protein
MMELLPSIIEKMENPILVLCFTHDPNLAMAFCANFDVSGKLDGLSLYYTRNEEKAQRANPDLIEAIFRPRLVPDGLNKYVLHITPLEDGITIIHKNDKLLCQLPFRNEKKIGKLVCIDVDITFQPLEVYLHIHGTYRSTKTSPPTKLKHSIRASNELTKKVTLLLGD